MTAPLQMHQPHDRHEMADVQARRGRIESDVAGRDARCSSAPTPSVC